jgi:RHS repeat-associated protein
MPSVSSDYSIDYAAMLPANWMPQSDPMIPPFGDFEVKNGIQAPHVASSSELEHLFHNSNTVNELQPCYAPKKTGGVTVYGYRHYNPKTGQFLGRDPIQELGGENLYGFVGNDGVSRLDVLGKRIRIVADSRVQDHIDKYRARSKNERADRLQNSMNIGVDYWSGVIEEVRLSNYGQDTTSAFWEIDNGPDYTIVVGSYETPGGYQQKDNILQLMGEQAPLGYKYTYEVIGCKCKDSDKKIPVILKQDNMEGGAMMAHELRHLADHRSNKLSGLTGDKTEDPKRWYNRAEYRAVEEENRYRSRLGINKRRLAYLETWFTESGTEFTKKYTVVGDCGGDRGGENGKISL